MNYTTALKKLKKIKDKKNIQAIINDINEANNILKGLQKKYNKNNDLIEDSHLKRRTKELKKWINFYKRSVVKFVELNI